MASGFLIASVAGACLVAIGQSLPAESVQTTVWPTEMLDDADLNDVCFVDPRRGTAVGDRGVIWHTEDGGQHWQRRLSTVRWGLNSVHFVDRQHGWAVGGWTHPCTFWSTGVVLRSSDGGQHWARTPTQSLPMLTRVHFGDPQHGWTTGRGSALYPTGVFVTSNGGDRWATVPGRSTAGWAAGSFPSAFRGIAASATGQLFVLSPATIRPLGSAFSGLRRIRDLQIDAHGRGLLVGDGGLVVTTPDGGRTWRLPTRLVAGEGEAEFDFATAAIRDGHCWIAGSPGTCVFHSSDGGLRWDAHRTGSRVPIRALTFVDTNHGWAVGSLGTILATGDGGVTWHRQAGAGTRVAVLAICDRVESVPWEIVSHAAGGEGYRTRIVVVGCSHSRDTFGRVPMADRFSQAAMAVGAAGADMAWQFPVDSPRLRMPASKIVQRWGVGEPTRPDWPVARQRLEEYLVRTIRLWRPDVVLTTSGGDGRGDALPRLVRQSVLRAVGRADSDAAFARQIAVAGLPTWRVKQVFADVPEQGPRPLSVPLSTAQLVLPLGRSLAELATTARELVSPDIQPAPAMVRYRAILDVRSGDTNVRRLSDISLPPGGDGRRSKLPVAAVSVRQLQHTAQLRRNVEALVARLDRQADGGARLLGGLARLTGQFDSETAGEIQYQIARRFQQAGHADLAADVLRALVRDHPTHPLAEAALVELVRYGCSDEWRWRQRDRVETAIQRAAVPGAEPEAAPGLPRIDQPPLQVGKSAGGKQGAAASPIAPRVQPAVTGGRWSEIVSLEQQIRRTRPELFVEPVVRLPLLAAYRDYGHGQQARKHRQSLLASAPSRDWRSCVQGEIWLDQQRGKPPRPVLHCVKATERPRLDGGLHDTVWQGEQRAVLRSVRQDDRHWPAVVYLAHDHQFLYLAARCVKAAGARYPVSSGPRPRDSDLGNHDRIQLSIDINRDYTSAWRLSIDHRGWTGERCLDDATWDPTWYVATAGDKDDWRVEAAIPLTELAPRPPAAGEAWVIELQRTVPGAGFQSWARLASPDTAGGEGSGYLIFD